MKYKVFIILLLSRIYSTDVIVNGIKIATKRPGPANWLDVVRDLEWLDTSASLKTRLHQGGHMHPNNAKQMPILNNDVLKIITMLPYTPDALKTVVISTRGKDNVKVTWGDVLEILKQKNTEAEDALKSPIQYFFPSYNIKLPYSDLLSQRANQNIRELALFAANFIICDIPKTRVFNEQLVVKTFQSAQNYLDAKNYKFFDDFDRELYGNYRPSMPERPSFKYYMIPISKVRYAVAVFLQYVEEKRIQDKFEKLKQHLGI